MTMRTALPDDAPHSPAMAFLAHAYAYRSRAVQASIRRTKEGMRQTLTLAIQLGLPFALRDFTWLATNPRPAYYDTSPFGFRALLSIETSKNSGEGWYTAAIQHEHMTACQSFEHWKGRRPFVVQGTRLHIGAVLTWQEHLAFVTSFRDEEGTLTACSYAQAGRQFHRNGRAVNAGYGAIQHRFTITHASLAAASRSLQTTIRAHSVPSA
jgi:hypothetical protein